MNDVAIRSPRILSVCTGAGGLDLGVRLACESARTVCYVEREAFAVANLVAAMEAGFMDEAPIWSDLETFDGKPWRGVVDWLVGGIPCQPHSVAGLRRGGDDERDLWPDTARIIGEIYPRIVFLENVSGIVRYYWDRIRPELHQLGYQTQEGLFSAAEVGASHIRQRLFVLAYSERGNAWRLGLNLAGTSGSSEGEAREQRVRADSEDADRRVAHAEHAEWRTGCEPRRTEWPDIHEQGRPEGAGRAGVGNETVAHADDSAGSAEPELEHQGRRLQDHDPGEPGSLADAIPEQGLFPPAPTAFDEWAHVLTEVPSLEPAFCRKADGVAWWLDATAYRAHRLRVLGNGVVPLVVAYAFRTLYRRALE